MKTIRNDIIDIVDEFANNNPAPISCKVVKVYEDGCVDVSVDGGVLEYIECIGSRVKGNIGIVVFLDGDYNSPFALLDSE